MEYKVLKEKVDLFFHLAEREIPTKPWLMVIAMHEYFRNIFPADIYLPFHIKENHVKRISTVIDNCTEFLESGEKINSYFNASNKFRSFEKIEEVYGMLWDKFKLDMFKEETLHIMDERFSGNVNFTDYKDKIILDLGTGSGRYAMCLAMITKAKMVYAVDLHEDSLNKAIEISKLLKIKNIKFIKANVLNTQFKDNTFDFVFCNGVLHHTESIEKGIKEIYRVLKPGSKAFIYIYGAGGIFWYSRKRMNKFMKKIPQTYSMKVLELIGMPSNRFIFADNWYVPKEEHTTTKQILHYIETVGFKNPVKLLSKRETDLDNPNVMASPYFKLIYGDGEHRYFATK